MQIRLNWGYWRRVWFNWGDLSVGFSCSIYRGLFALLWRRQIVIYGPKRYKELCWNMYIGKRMYSS